MDAQDRHGVQEVASSNLAAPIAGIVELTGYLWVRRLSGFGPAATLGCYLSVAVADTDPLGSLGNQRGRACITNRWADFPPVVPRLPCKQEFTGSIPVDSIDATACTAPDVSHK